MTVAFVSILAQDRVGLVSEIADHLFEAGANLGDATFALLGTGAEFSAICELPSHLSVEILEQDLLRLPTLAAAQVRVGPLHVRAQARSDRQGYAPDHDQRGRPAGP